MRIAISGHQNLGDKETIRWVFDELEFNIKKINVEEGYSCLAVGADQLFAEIILKNNIPLIAIIPSRNYEITFDNNHIKAYEYLLKKANKVVQLEHSQPTESAFFEASKFMLNNCELLIAIWNGLPSKGLGGTADVVNYAIETKKNIIHINPLTKSIKIYKHGKS